MPPHATRPWRAPAALLALSAALALGVPLTEHGHRGRRGTRFNGFCSPERERTA